MRVVSESLEPLRERRFRLLWLARTGSSIGDALMPVAFAFAVLDATSSTTVLGVSLALFTVSRLAFTLAGGVWADRLPRRLVLVTSDFGRATVQAVLAALLFAGRARGWEFVGGSVVFGSADAFFGPASTGLVRDIVSTGLLQRANALLALSGNAAGIVGPGIAGAIVATAGAGWAFAIDAGSFVASAGFVFAMGHTPTPVAGEPQTFFADLAEGWREVRSRVWLWASFVTFSFDNISLAAFFVLGPLVAKEHLGGASAWGIIVSAGAAGGLVGALLALRWHPRRPLLPAYLTMQLVALDVVALAIPVPLALLAVANAAGGFALAFGNTLWETTLQQHIPQHVLARVSAYDWLVSLIFMPLGFALAPLIAGSIGTRTTLLAPALVIVAGNAGILLLRSVRRLERVDATG